MNDVDIDNLTKQNFIELAQYVQYLEAEVEKYKTASLVLYTQRNNSEKKAKHIESSINNTNRGTLCNICYKHLNDTIDIEIEQI